MEQIQILQDERIRTETPEADFVGIFRPRIWAKRLLGGSRRPRPAGDFSMDLRASRSERCGGLGLFNTARESESSCEAICLRSGVEKRRKPDVRRLRFGSIYSRRENSRKTCPVRF